MAHGPDSRLSINFRNITTDLDTKQRGFHTGCNPYLPLMIEKQATNRPSENTPKARPGLPALCSKTPKPTTHTHLGAPDSTPSPAIVSQAPRNHRVWNSTQEGPSENKRFYTTYVWYDELNQRPRMNAWGKYGRRERTQEERFVVRKAQASCDRLACRRKSRESKYQYIHTAQPKAKSTFLPDVGRCTGLQSPSTIDHRPEGKWSDRVLPRSSVCGRLVTV